MDPTRAREIFALIEDLARQARRRGADPAQILDDVAHHAARGRAALEPPAAPRPLTFPELEAQLASAGSCI